MRITVFLLLLFSAVLFSLFANGDTTYTPTRSVSKKNHQPSDHNHTSGGSGYSLSVKETNYADDSEEDDGFLSKCICSGGDEEKSLSEIGTSILLFPFKVVFCVTVYEMGLGFWKTNKHLFVGNPTLDRWQSHPLHSGIGFALGATFLPGQAAGPQGAFNLDFYWRPAPMLQLRERLGIDASPMAAFVDYERDMYVNGTYTATVHDEVFGTLQRNYSLITDLLIPFRRDGSFYLAAGGGAVYMTQKTDVTRTVTPGDAAGDLTVRSEAWYPAISLAIGRFAEFKKLYGTYEIGCTGVFTPNNHKRSVPADNARFSHSITMRWSMMF